MKKRNLVLLVVGSFSILLAAVNAPAATNALSTAEIEGRRLAWQLIEQRPAENSTIKGVLKDPKGKRPEIPVVFETSITASNWQTLYYTRGTNKDNAASLTIIHTDDLPNEYRLANISRPRTETNEFIALSGNQTMVPFAGSDFWIADLGLEFLHWPAQRILEKRLHKGQSCADLESTNPNPAGNGYGRVVSWIMIDTGGIIHAEAYDAKGKLLKEFDPKNLEKVNGQWQVQEMQIHNIQTGSRTQLEFELGQK